MIANPPTSLHRFHSAPQEQQNFFNHHRRGQAFHNAKSAKKSCAFLAQKRGKAALAERESANIPHNLKSIQKPFNGPQKGAIYNGPVMNGPVVQGKNGHGHGMPKQQFTKQHKAALRSNRPQQSPPMQPSTSKQFFVDFHAPPQRLSSPKDSVRSIPTTPVKENLVPQNLPQLPPFRQPPLLQNSPQPLPQRHTVAKVNPDNRSYLTNGKFDVWNLVERLAKGEAW
ncbi:hypothetical protein L596_015580 [Steinernema carpocapsae]|uniref:Uncharacterized protein n=1 Tax=Steinernema carpocapsae TaxID=34508 RepID=A0A4U5NFF4_STECR|nr:hypothetical protein L596_015580 [Steinernema carpocapsae]